MASSSFSGPSGDGGLSTSYDRRMSKDLEARKGSVTAQAYQMRGPEEHELDDVSIDHDLRRGSVVEVAKARRIQNSFGPLRKLRQAEEWLDAKLGVETRGVDRIPEEEKQPPSVINIFLFWFSLNVHVGALALGILGPEFGLDLGSSIGAVTLGTALGSLCTAFNGTLGPKLGLRQIATSRYSLGYWGAMIASVLNVIIGGGFAVVNFVAVGQILSAVADYNLTITAGIIIIAVVSYLISVFGYSIIHTFEKYSWIYTAVLFIVLLVQVGPYVDSSIPSTPPSGLGYAGSFLTILAINFSNASGWCSIAADYYCNYPASTSALLVFGLTWTGITVATVFSVSVGAVIGNAALTAAYPPFNEAYENHFLGGLLREIYHPLGWSKFALVLLMFSVLGNNVAIFYSTGLSMQLFGSYFLAVPRFIWSLIAAIIIAVIAIAGQEHLSLIVSNFVSLLGYWTISFTVILLLEDKWFRRSTGYNLEAWNTPSKLPLGAAGVLALLAGYLAGGVPGMSQTWYVGPIARKFSEYGGDVGIYLSGVITLLVYPIARTVEKRMTGR